MKKRLIRILVTLLIVSAATVLQSLLWKWITPSPFLLYFPAIILSARYGDEICAVIFSIFLAQHFFVKGDILQKDMISMAVFLSSGIIIRFIVRSQLNEKIKSEAVANELAMEKSARIRFVTSLTHDLKNPMTAMKLSAQMIQKNSPKTDICQGHAHKIIKNIQRTDDMINDLLDVTQIKAGQSVDLDIGPCDLNAICEDVIKNLKVTYGDRFKLVSQNNIKGEWSCESIHRIIENLCSNGAKYGIKEKPVTVNLRSQDDMVEIEVHNDGNPIAHEDLPTLFDPYKRPISTEESGIKGWGLGLSLVKGLTEAHGGTVDVRSDAQEGTYFTVFLPRICRASLAS